MNRKHALNNNLSARIISCLGFACIFLTHVSTSASEFKHVAVPAEQMEKQKLADAENKGVFSHSTMLPVYQSQSSSTQLKNNQIRQDINMQINLDGLSNSPIILIGPQAEQWQMKVINPDGLKVYDESGPDSSILYSESIAIGHQMFKGKKFIMQNPVAGAWSIKLSRNLSTAKLKENLQVAKNSELPEAYLMFKGDSDYQLYSFIDNNFTTQNSHLNLVAYMLEAKQEKGDRGLMLQKQPLQGSLKQVHATITSPSKKIIRVRLNDAGIKGDKIAGDGLYSASVPTDEVGTYTSQVQVKGVRPDGIDFSRTVTDLYPVAVNSFSFNQTAASLTSTGPDSGILSVSVNRLADSDRVFLSAEIWGVDPKGNPKSAVWVGGVVSPKESKSGTELQLDFDTRWLRRANIKAPFSLKAIRLQDVDNNVPLAELDSLAVKADKNIALLKSLNTLVIDEKMLMGKKTVSDQIQLAAANPKLLLVHGYCSGQVWNTSNFSNSAEFKDYSQNRSHDQFAQQLINFGAAYDSYGIVAHSQGGAAALHLYSKYWSGLDYATGGRLIQSVGTPYQGTALAGNLALLGQIFGAGCGTNTDLTYNGAANWLATIPSWARSQVDYYTTSFNTRWWAYDYCHIATDLFLSDPDDGTTEKWSGQLSGGINKGHKTGWCHTNGMRDTAQYKDSSRNASMSSRAAR